MFDKNMCDDTFIMTFHQLAGGKKGFLNHRRKPALHIQTYSILAMFPETRTMWSETPISNDYLTCFYEYVRVR
jgi:hypothetical protein